MEYWKWLWHGCCVNLNIRPDLFVRGAIAGAPDDLKVAPVAHCSIATTNFAIAFGNGFAIKPSMNVAIDISIPGKMSIEEMQFLAALARQVPAGGNIVEVGPFYGRSTHVMARSNPLASIHSIDTFEDVEWTRNYADSYREIPPFGLEAFRYFTRDCPNVTPIKGFSPDVVSDWDAPVDMYFEDAIHGNPGLRDNLDFWISHLQPGGILCGHDYSLRFIDVKRESDGWAQRWNTQVAIVGSLWAIRKPVGNAPPAPLHLPLDEFSPLRLRVKNRRKGYNVARGGYWAGAHLDADPMIWLDVIMENSASGTGLEYRLGNAAGRTTGWIPAGQKARLEQDGKPVPFTRIAARLTGPNPDRLKVVYQTSARQIGNGGYRLSKLSKWTSDGDWCHATPEQAAISSLTIRLARGLPGNSQGAFTPRPKNLLKVKGKALMLRLKQRLGNR